MRSPLRRVIVPLSGSSSPMMIRSSEDLPVPLTPTSPTLSPSRSESEMSAKRTLLPKLRETLFSCSILNFRFIGLRSVEDLCHVAHRVIAISTTMLHKWMVVVLRLVQTNHIELHRVIPAIRI